MAERRLSIVRETYEAPFARAPASTAPGAPLELVPPPPPRSRLGRWPRRVFVLVVCLWLFDAGISGVIRYSGFQKRLTARLSAAFGRPVDVRGYNFNLWTGPVLQAKGVVVAEDPRFGNEYFIRAESLTVRPRWKGIFHGRLELGTLSLSQPSLNVVRNSAGDWNLAEWLPRSSTHAGGAGASSGALPFEGIRVEGGRVNFKVGDEKLPFAFVGVTGSVATEGGDRWRMDLQATPWRVSTLTQQAGQIQVSAQVGGTSSRMLPASLAATWTNTSVSDALRLARGDDYGIRGNFSAAITARTRNGEWNVQTRAEMRQLHRWNLALRSDNPDLNFLGLIRVNPETSELELISGTLEAPHSNAHVAGHLDWEEANGLDNKRAVAAPRLEFSNATVDFKDALAWVRAFRAGISDRITLEGFATVEGSVVGWPARIQNFTLASGGADLTGLGLRVPVHVGNMEARYDATHFYLSSVGVTLGPRKAPGAGEFRIDAAVKPGSAPVLNRTATVHVTGGSANVDNLVTAANTLGWNLARGWAIDGPGRVDLRWQGTRQDLQAGRVQPVGVAELGVAAAGDPGAGGAKLRAPFLNLPIEQIKMRIDLKPGSRHVTVSSAQAFGARWSGTFDWREPQAQWQFDMSADRLAASDLDRWLNPRWRESFIDRVLPFLNTRSGTAATPELLRATGRLSVDALTIGALALHNIKGTLAVGGRHVELSNAVARFYGGGLSGSLVAELTALPSYQVAADFSSVDIASMTQASEPLSGLFAGSASGQISFAARGSARADLVSSLECEGTASVTDAQLSSVNFSDAGRDRGDHPNAPGSDFSRASAAFTCGDSKVQLRELSLIEGGQEMEGAGAVDFGRNVDLRLHVLRADGEAAETDELSEPEMGTQWYQLSGALAAPRIAVLPPPPRRGR